MVALLPPQEKAAIQSVTHLRADGLLESGNQESENPPEILRLWSVCREATACRSLLSGQVAATHRLEGHDDIGDL